MSRISGFGGFKAIFSQQSRHSELLSRFGRSFDQILDGYLPSRKGVKARKEKFELDDQVLELFVGLDDDECGSVDLEEPLTDLLYFVVDLLQFQGERNAYDEIDFDGMAVDVLDALRVYHEAATQERSQPQHLVLVLDRRLQAFPWESLPYLESASVSRVGSMLSLRECIMAMKMSNSNPQANEASHAKDYHTVPRTSGTFILNPSSDLKGTQTTLNPALSSLVKCSDFPWTSIVNEIPDEGPLRGQL